MLGQKAERKPSLLPGRPQQPVLFLAARYFCGGFMSSLSVLPSGFASDNSTSASAILFRNPTRKRLFFQSPRHFRPSPANNLCALSGLRPTRRHVPHPGQRAHRSAVDQRRAEQESRLCKWSLPDFTLIDLALTPALVLRLYVFSFFLFSLPLVLEENVKG